MSQKVWSELTADQVAPVEQTALFDAPAEDVADEVCAQCGSPRSSNRHQFSEGHSFVPSHAPAPAPEAPQERPDAEYAAGYAEDGTVQRGAWVRVRLASGRHEVAQVTGLAAYSGTRGARVDGISTHSWVPLHRITAVITNSGDVAPIEPAETSTERHLANRCREVVGEHCHCSLEYDRPEGGRRPCMVCDAPAPAPEAPQERPDAEYAAGYAEGQRARAEDGAQPVSAAALGTLDTPHARGYRAGYLAVDMAAPADAPCVDTYRCAKVVSSASSPHREDAP